MILWLKIDCKGQIAMQRYAVYGIIIVEGDLPAKHKVYLNILQALHSVKELKQCVG